MDTVVSTHCYFIQMPPLDLKAASRKTLQKPKSRGKRPAPQSCPTPQLPVSVWCETCHHNAAGAHKPGCQTGPAPPGLRAQRVTHSDGRNGRMYRHVWQERQNVQSHMAGMAERTVTYGRMYSHVWQEQQNVQTRMAECTVTYGRNGRTHSHVWQEWQNIQSRMAERTVRYGRNGRR